MRQGLAAQVIVVGALFAGCVPPDQYTTAPFDAGPDRGDTSDLGEKRTDAAAPPDKPALDADVTATTDQPTDPDATPCAPGQIGCAGRCLDPTRDPMNCGACNVACPSGQPCAAGMCGCPSGQTSCAGVGCVELSRDFENCGACGARCVTGQTCANGACTCPTGLTACGAGASGACVDLQATNANCGACGNACPTGQSCVAGSCACPSGFTACGSGAGATCVNPQTDNANCGGCGTACSLPNATAVCVTGTCRLDQCAPGFGDCNPSAPGCETNTATDASNCGACGTRCVFANAGAACVGGVCQMGSCNAGFADCDLNPSNGCETNTQTDVNNCGSCRGMPCSASAGRTAFCAGGTCMMGTTCTSPLADCNGVSGDGCEVNTGTDANHCGGCGRPCDRTNGTPTCAGGACVAVACNAGFGNCDANVANGCEVNFATSPNHCGMCGNRCVFANAAAGCASGACTLGACATGYGNCDGNAANGCETSLGESNSNCGACGRACTGGQACVGGNCVCPASLSNCGGTCLNVMGSDNNNCGACGRACTGGQLCAAGVCVCPTGQLRCGSVCVNAQTDNNNCGTCGRVCNTLERCSAGVCTSVCPSGAPTDCSAAGAGCVNTNTDAQHCGACGNRCATGLACSRGRCVATPDTIALGDYHSCVVLAGGVHCWGFNSVGQLGDGTTTSRVRAPLTPTLAGVTQVAAGAHHSCAVMSNGTLRCWGANNAGQLGYTTTSMCDYVGRQVPCSTTPTEVPGLSGVARVALGGAFTCALLLDGTVRCWGDNFYRQLGYTTAATCPDINGVSTQRCGRVPTEVPGLANVSQIAAGYFRLCALVNDGTVRCLGNGTYGEPGYLSSASECVNCIPSPTTVSGLSNIIQVAVGNPNTCAVSANGGLQCWGSNNLGELGLGTTSAGSATPLTVPGVSSTQRVALAQGQACALSSVGLSCWGNSAYGELGYSPSMTCYSEPCSASPRSVPGTSGVSQVGASWYHTCALVNDRSVLCWGRNQEGQIGDGTRTNRSTATPVLF